MKQTQFAILALAVITLSCKDNTDKDKENAQVQEVMDKEEHKNEEIALFTGQDLKNWKAYNADTITKWTVEDGAIALSPKAGKGSGSENLISKEQFENFELSLEWKISEGGNSGIMWGVQEGEKFNEPYLTGPEIQVLDNKKHPDAKNGPVRQAGALYDMVPPAKDVTKPVGEWNSMVITIDHQANKGSISMNGEKINEFPVHGEEWEKMVAKSKFKDWEDFGKSKKGHIALQDHGDKVWYRNIQVKSLD